jgi:hypothetical protein
VRPLASGIFVSSLSAAANHFACQTLCLYNERCVAWMWNMNPDLQCGDGSPPYNAGEGFGCKNRVRQLLACVPLSADTNFTVCKAKSKYRPQQRFSCGRLRQPQSGLP